MNQNRREFIKTASSFAAVSMLPNASGFNGDVCFFSKHLPDMDWTRLAQAVKKLGFGGIDLTVRPGGHVAPERAAEDLPETVAAIRAEGLSVPMITTGLTSAGDPAAKPILSTAGKLSIPFFKPGYYKYSFADVRGELKKAMNDFRALTEISKQSGVQCGFHNHEGNIGAQLWDVAQTIDQLDPKWVGYYFDIRHAVAEGGVAGWKIALNLAAPRIKMIAVKDSYWEKSNKGWRQVNCPLGQGMVDWRAYFKALRQAHFHGPISLHLEYDIPGATKAAVEENTLAAAQRDFEFLKARLQEAYLV
ncbi:MAG TPA: sugar phosphate isomerase/epimerase family protein [Blastocatellia bacterium]|nr:sugar phosphate isomerase/epimerase family protein [Blastocatellia bacterium]